MNTFPEAKQGSVKDLSTCPMTIPTLTMLRTDVLVEDIRSKMKQCGMPTFIIFAPEVAENFEEDTISAIRELGLKIRKRAGVANNAYILAERLSR